MSLKLATWNINSVRLRIGLVTKLLEGWQPDVLCLQETKCPQGQFPSAPVRAQPRAGRMDIRGICATPTCM